MKLLSIIFSSMIFAAALAQADCETTYREAIKSQPNPEIEKALQLILSAKYAESLGAGVIPGHFDPVAEEFTTDMDQITELSFPLIHVIRKELENKNKDQLGEHAGPLTFAGDFLRVSHKVAHNIFKNNDQDKYCKDGQVLGFEEIKSQVVQSVSPFSHVSFFPL